MKVPKFVFLKEKSLVISERLKNDSLTRCYLCECQNKPNFQAADVLILKFSNPDQIFLSLILVDRYNMGIIYSAFRFYLISYSICILSHKLRFRSQNDLFRKLPRIPLETKPYARPCLVRFSKNILVLIVLLRKIVVKPYIR